MKVAVIGSRDLTVEDLGPFLPAETSEIVSGGARGIDRCARLYAGAHGLVLTEFLPDYRRYGRGAPSRRNRQIVEYADTVVALWDGKSRGTDEVIRYCRKTGVPVRVFSLEKSSTDGAGQ